MNNFRTLLIIFGLLVLLFPCSDSFGSSFPSMREDPSFMVYEYEYYDYEDLKYYPLTFTTSNRSFVTIHVGVNTKLNVCISSFSDSYYPGSFTFDNKYVINKSTTNYPIRFYYGPHSKDYYRDQVKDYLDDDPSANFYFRNHSKVTLIDYRLYITERNSNYYREREIRITFKLVTLFCLKTNKYTNFLK